MRCSPESDSEAEQGPKGKVSTFEDEDDGKGKVNGREDDIVVFQAVKYDSKSNFFNFRFSVDGKV